MSTFIVAACWLSVATIMAGLFCSNIVIWLRHKSDLASGIEADETQVRIKLLPISRTADVSKLTKLNVLLGTTTLKHRLFAYKGLIASLAG
jgi:hypothetical protein